MIGLEIVQGILIVDNGTTLAYESLGSQQAPPIVLIQGYTAQLVGWPSGFCHQLVQAGFRVIRFDNRDVGMSQRFPDIPYRIEDMADDVAGLIRALALDSAHVVGQSMGGLIAQEVAIRHPELVKTLTILYSTPMAGSHFVRPANDVAAPHEVESDCEAVADYVRNESHTMTGRYPLDEAFLWELGHEVVRRGWDPAGAARQRNAMQHDRDRRRDLQQLRVPTLIIHGSEDPLISPEGGRELASLIPGARLDLIDGMVHAVPPQLWSHICEELKAHAALGQRKE